MTQTNYAVAPGRYLEEWLEDENMTQAEAGQRLGYSRKHVNSIVNGHAQISDELATRLERLTKIPATSWLTFEAAYRADLARLKDEEDLAKHASEIHPEAAKFLRQIGVTSATMRAGGRLVSDFLAYHRCGTWDAFLGMHEERTTGEYALAALKEHKAELDPTLLSCWLRAGELEEQYELGRTGTYDEAALRALLPTLRERVSRPDDRLLADVGELLASAGVVFMLVAPPAKFPLYGMTRWIDKRVPVIQQTGRRQSDGFVIWTLFHEIGHVLNDPRGEVHVDFRSEKQRNTVAERGANAFALETLFGEAGLAPLQGVQTDREIRDAARQIGVSPGLVLLQLHRRKQLPYNWGNNVSVNIGSGSD